MSVWLISPASPLTPQRRSVPLLRTMPGPCTVSTHHSPNAHPRPRRRPPGWSPGRPPWPAGSTLAVRSFPPPPTRRPTNPDLPRPPSPAWQCSPGSESGLEPPLEPIRYASSMAHTDYTGQGPAAPRKGHIGIWSSGLSSPPHTTAYWPSRDENHPGGVSRV